MFGSFRDLAFLGAAAGSGVALDPDAQAYITAVETVDGQALEAGVRAAINDFVVGCKADGIWTAIKASCILAGARTLNGALVPLVGVAPTNFNFVSGDYNRKTGLVGDGSTKYLNSNRSNNADPQNSKHLALYATSASTLLDSTYFGTEFLAGSSHISVSTTTQSSLGLRNNSSGNFWPTLNSNAIGFMGHSRDSSTNVNTRANAINGAIGLTSVAPSNILLTVYARNASPLTNYSNARLAFYSIGESLGLALLDARVTDLINAFGAAIP
jgi:hypothetical protein